MKLTIAVALASIIVRFETPGPGRYFLFSDVGDHLVRVEASNHATNAVHVAVSLPQDTAHKLMWVQFVPDE